jgi:hypothetical protein
MNLELVTTQDLYDELKRRCEHLVIAGLMKRPTEDDPEHCVMSYVYSGIPFICQGLAIQVIVRCQRDIDEMKSEMDVSDL